ncbi:MAG: tetratricopeptide repeat protein [Planctomycetota bacterium]
MTATEFATRRCLTLSAVLSRPSALMITLLLALPGVSFADTVTVATGKEGRRRVTRTGRIADYKGESLRLLRDGQRDEIIPATRVVRFEIDWPEGYSAAQSHFRQGDYPAALDLLRQAAKLESRDWGRERLQARACECYREMGDWERAAELFVKLYQADRKTAELGVIPLRWSLLPVASNTWQSELGNAAQQQARDWLRNSPEPAERLLGASWLLDGELREEAIDVLQALAKQAGDGDSRLRQLAVSQLWRARAASAKTEDLELWERQLAGFDEAVRAGPYLVLAESWADQKQSQRAAWNYLRLPTLFPAQQALVRYALQQAAQQLDALGQPAAAARLRAEPVVPVRSDRE